MRAHCKAVGEIDRVTAPVFDAELRDAIDRSDETTVSVDCSGVTFMDSAGYLVLRDAAEYAAHRGQTLVIRDMSPSCAMIIRVCDPNHGLCVNT